MDSEYTVLLMLYSLETRVNPVANSSGSFEDTVIVVESGVSTYVTSVRRSIDILEYGK